MTVGAWILAIVAVCISVALWITAELELVGDFRKVRRLQGAAVALIVLAVLAFPTSWALGLDWFS